MMTDANLTERCQALINGAQGALSWIADGENAETIGPANRDITRNMRRILRRANKLHRALDRNTSVSVFGPSQAGKSFLVSVLARPQNGPLVAEFGGQGEVSIEDGAIIMNFGESLTGVTYTGGDLPKNDYEVRVEAKRVDGIDFFCGLTFPVADSYCSFIVGGWAGSVRADRRRRSTA